MPDRHQHPSYKTSFTSGPTEHETHTFKTRHRPPPHGWRRRHLTRRTVLIGLIELGVASGSLSWLIYSHNHPEEGTILYLRINSLGGFQALSWSHQGALLAIGEAHDVEVWEATKGDHARVYGTHNDQITTIAWSPDDRQLASGSRDQTIQLWDTSSQAHLLTYAEHHAPIWHQEAMTPQSISGIPRPAARSFSMWSNVR